MLKKMSTLNNKEDGFTLIELLVVILIIGILAAIAIPVFLNQQKAAVDAGVKSDVRNTTSNVALFLTSHPDTLGNVTAIGAPKTETATTPAVVVSDSESVVAVKFTTAGVYTITGTSGKTNNTYVYDSSTGKFQ